MPIYFGRFDSEISYLKKPIFLRNPPKNLQSNGRKIKFEFLDPECIRERDLSKLLFFGMSTNKAKFNFFVKLNDGTHHMTIYGLEVDQKWTGSGPEVDWMWSRSGMQGIYKRRALVPCNFWFKKFFLKIRLISDIETLIRQLAQLSITLRYYVLRSEIHLHIQRNQNF